MMIMGAGLSGLLAAHAFPLAEVFEASAADRLPHRALLRFRTGAVGEAVGIDFRKVRVRKGIWMDRRFVQPDIRNANLYAAKVSGQLLDRSIWNVDSVERFIAPDDFIAQMTDAVRSRIRWSTPITSLSGHEPVISTVPMPVLANILHTTHPVVKEAFKHAEIYVSQYTIPGADVFQTVYFPSPDTPVYRASITGNTLIIESIEPNDDVEMVCEAFGIANLTACGIMQIVSIHEQKYGKIAPITDHVRRSFISHATQQYNVYALGRFAIWKNVLMDDVLHDLHIIKRLLRTDQYGRNLINGVN
jgi:hypothetical protein